MGDYAAPLLGPWTAILSFLAILIVNTVSWLAKRHKAAVTGCRRAQLSAELAFLKREAVKLNTPSTYAKCAKYQRLANAKEKELKELSAPGAVPTVPERLVLLCNSGKMLLLGLLTMTLWESAVAHVPPALSSPVGRLLGFPRLRDFGSFGLVAVGPWLLLCDSATTHLAKAAFPQPAVTVSIDTDRLAREAEAAKRVVAPLS